jgi:SAM-dependent methyltransferase
VDSGRFSAIAHGELAILNPIGPDSLDRMLDRLALRPGDAVIDFGCGKAEMLLRLLEITKVRAVGIDLNPRFIADAREAAARRAPGAALTLIEGDATRYAEGRGTFDAALAIGATHVFGGLRASLAALGLWVRPGGRILVGEGYWKHEPHPDYLAVLGATPDELTDHAGNLAIGMAAGLEQVAAIETALDDWDRYEDTYAANVEIFAAENPDDPDREAMLKRIRGWRDAYLRWGRETLGFALYLFRKPSAP